MMALNKHELMLWFNLQRDSKIKAKKYITQNQFNFMPKGGDIKLVEEELPPLKDNGMYVVIKCSTIYMFMVIF